MSCHARRGRRMGRGLAAGVLGGVVLAAATPPPTTTPATSRNPTIRVGRGYTLLDPSLALPPLTTLVPELASRTPAPADAASPPPGDGDAPLAWQLDYRRAQLGAQLPSAALRSDPAAGFSRQLDTDVLALRMSWRLAGSRVGLAYQLQSARGGHGADAGLSRFLPGSEATTHAVTVGVTREFGAGAPPPVPLPLPVPAASTSSATLPTAAAATPSPAP